VQPQGPREPQGLMGTQSGLCMPAGRVTS
jgi:hypothetical protein